MGDESGSDAETKAGGDDGNERVATRETAEADGGDVTVATRRRGVVKTNGGQLQKNGGNRVRRR